MNKPSKAVLTTALLAACAAQANENLEDLVVSASADTIQATQFGGTLTVITAAQIEAARAQFLSDVLRQVPGFSVSQSGGIGTQTQIRVRGAESNHLLVMIDGIRVNDPAIGDDFLSSYGLTDQIERIEIIRGPQSALWGTDALAGVINIITRSGQQSQWGADLEYGSHHTKSLGVNGTWKQPSASLDASIRSIDSAGTNISRQGTEADGFENTEMQLTGRFQAGDDWRWLVQASHADGMNEYDGTDFTTSLPADSDVWTEVRQTRAQLHAEYVPADGRWHSSWSAKYRESDNDNFTLGGFSTGSTASDTQTLQWHNNIFLGSDSQNRLSVLFDHQDIDFNQTGLASSFGDPNQKQSYAVLGTAMELALQATDDWFWQFSARQDDFNRFEDVSSFNASTSFAFSDAWRLRANLGTGSKAPTFIERFGYTPDSFLGNPNLKPEESDAWEVGVEYAQSGHRLSLVYFDQNLENEINGFTFDPTSGMFTAVNKAGVSERSGVELTWFSQFTDNLSLDFNYTYTDATEENGNGDQIREIRRPKNMANATLNYAFADHRGHLYTQVRYQGKQYDYFFDPVTFAAVPTALSAATTVDLTVSWQWTDHIDVYLKGQNIFDEDQEEVLGYARPGATYAIGIKTTF